MRDLDVQGERLGRAAPLLGRKTAASIAAVVGERRERARETMLAALDSERYVAVIDTIADLLRAEPAAGPGEQSAARASSETDLHHRVALDGPNDELKELADTLDSLLEALEKAFTSQRAFSANVSHELRTPLAILRAEAEIKLNDPNATEAERDFARRILDSTEQGERTVDGLLALARSESGLLTRTQVDFAELTGDVVGGLAASASNIELTLELGEATVWGDRALLERLVANLVENAIRHNVIGGSVRVEVTEEEGVAILRVGNSGARVEANEVETYFEPFVRRTDEGAARGGLGLGLSIVRTIVESHGGTITARARDEGGLEIEVRLPRERGS